MTLPVAPKRGEVNSRSRERVSALERLEERQTHSATRVSALERLEEGHIQSCERVSALERIEPPMADPQRIAGPSGSLLARLQDVEVIYAEEEHQTPPGEAESSKRTSAALRLGSSSGSRKRNPPRVAATKTQQTKKTTQVRQTKKRLPAGKVTGEVRARGTAVLCKELVQQNNEQQGEDHLQRKDPVWRGTSSHKVYL